MIPVKNIYYMLSYAFSILREQGYKSVETESYENIGDLCAAILETGLKLQLKRGLYKDYRETTEQISTLKGKIDVSESIKSQAIQKHQLVCTYDEFTEDCPFNQILKSTIKLLIGSNISLSRKKSLRKVLIYLQGVSDIDLKHLDWNIRFDRTSQSYRMLVSVCYLVVKGLLQTTSSGNTKFMDFLDEKRMSWLYERFVFEYFRKEHPELKVSSPYIEWSLDGEADAFLPAMRSDIVLESAGCVLIIDTKYYSHNLQQRYEKKSIHSGNLYQIFTYVKNYQEQECAVGKQVSGMLLYAATDDDIQPDSSYSMSGNEILIKTLYLGSSFTEIRTQLETISNLLLQSLPGTAEVGACNEREEYIA